MGVEVPTIDAGRELTGHLDPALSAALFEGLWRLLEDDDHRA